MSERLNFERFFRFHDRIKPGAYPNTWPLAEKFKIQICTIQSIHLMHNTGNWHLLVWCTTHRQEILGFSVDHIKAITLTEETIRHPEDLQPIKNSIRRRFPHTGQERSWRWCRSAGRRTPGTGNARPAGNRQNDENIFATMTLVDRVRMI